MKHIYYICSVAVLAVLLGCSSSSSPNKPGKNLFPGAEGSYWVYGGYDIDNNNEKIEDSDYSDSTYYAGSEEMLGKTAMKFSTHSSYSAQIRSDYYSYDRNNEKLYTRETIILPNGAEFGFLANFVDPQWVLLADNKNANWQVLSKISIEEFDFKLNDMDVKVKPDYEVKGSKGTSSEIVINGNTYTAMEYILESIVTGTITVTVMSIPATLPLNYNIKTKIYLVDDIGIVKVRTDPSIFEIKAQNTVLYSEEFEGTEKTLVNYHITSEAGN